jgi:hypothetical protein
MPGGLSYMNQVGVVIVNWNGWHLTWRCLESLRHSDYPNLKYVVVDNGSADGSAEAVAAQYPEVSLIRNSANLGFAEGSNQGIRYAMAHGAAYILLLNNDTVVDEKMISFLVETAAVHENRVVVSPKMYDGFDPARLWFVYGKANLWTGIFSNPAYKAPSGSVFEAVLPMEYASGCCMLIPAGLISFVGVFDSRFFAYCEDVDWSLRARRAGIVLLCDTRAELWHYVTSTGARDPVRMRYLMTRNHLWTMRRHTTVYQFAVFALAFYPLRCLLRIVKAATRAQWGCIAAEFRAAFEGFLGPLNQRSSISG